MVFEFLKVFLSFQKCGSFHLFNAFKDTKNKNNLRIT